MKVDYDKFPDIPPAIQPTTTRPATFIRSIVTAASPIRLQAKRSTSARRLARSRTASSASASFTWPDKKI